MRRGVLTMVAVCVTGLAGCTSSSGSGPVAPSGGPASVASSSGRAAQSTSTSTGERVMSPCAQIPLATLNAAFRTTFAAGTVDKTFPTSPACNWTSVTVDVDLSLYPATESSYDAEIKDTTDSATYRRTQPVFGDDSTLNTDTALPGSTGLSVIDGGLEWVIDADAKNRDDTGPALLVLARALF